ncbi:MAG: hypothetical protein ACR2LU_00460 [Luteitalea sp.]
MHGDVPDIELTSGQDRLGVAARGAGAGQRQAPQLEVRAESDEVLGPSVNGQRLAAG